MNESDNKKMKIVLITTGQPSINPRIVKEADALTKAGHIVIVLYCHWVPWADEADNEILAGAKWKAVLVGGSPAKNKTAYLISRVWFKFYRKLAILGFLKTTIAEQAQARAFKALLKTAKNNKADYYIAHNLGALPVAVLAAEANNAKAGFDFEDYHRGEVKNKKPADEQRIVHLEDKYISRCKYISFASPMIGEKVLENFPKFQGKTKVIYNCFPLIEKSPQKDVTKKQLKLFWFSQTVGADRGLITALVALKLINDPLIKLTIVGQVSDQIKKYFFSILENSKVQLDFSGVVSPKEIDELAARSDVGLALEMLEPENRNLCLTNKIFTYLAAGNAIIFSETSAQEKFCQENKAGLLYKTGDAEALAKSIRFYQDEENLLYQKKHNRKLAETTFNWETESQKLVALLD